MFALLSLLASSAILTSAAPTSPINIGPDDVVLYGNGRYSLMKRTDLAELQAARENGIVPPMPNYLDNTLYHGPENSTSDSSLPTKRFDSSTVIIKNPASRFLGWDILMSSVLKGPSSIAVTSGYEISNSISVGTSATFTLVKDFLESSLSIDYTSSWTSSQSQQFTANVPEGKYGAFVSNPWTNRQSGNVFEGVIGSEGSLTYYQADSFESKSFDNLAWVDGVISLCTGDSFPMKRCLGDGTL